MGLSAITALLICPLLHSRLLITNPSVCLYAIGQWHLAWSTPSQNKEVAITGSALSVMHCKVIGNVLFNTDTFVSDTFFLENHHQIRH